MNYELLTTENYPKKPGIFKKQNAGFSAQIHRVSLKKKLFKKRHVTTLIVHIANSDRERKKFFSGRRQEDTHKKVFFFNGRTTKRVGRVNPLSNMEKIFFPPKIRLFKPKNCEEFFLSESVSAIIRLKKILKKGHGPLSH